MMLTHRKITKKEYKSAHLLIHSEYPFDFLEKARLFRVSENADNIQEILESSQVNRQLLHQIASIKRKLMLQKESLFPNEV